MPTSDRLVFERFFDDTGGMQLVVHSPHGGRINRALGLALRKKFCRTFNFELQAAATDDAVVLSLGPHHSFVLADVARYVHSSTVEDTLEHAILDSPMFQSRWRWNLNRSLMVLRFRGGRRNPPPIQRMEADDLMAAVFPQAAACQENATGPVEIPDHVLVRQTVDDTLHEALDADGLRALLEGVESGAVEVHCVETTEPSVLAHEILTARPYAFLDDEELQNRRTNAVHLRRGLAVDLTSIGALDPDAIAQVHAEVTPEPTTADDLHDLLASLVLTVARADWQPLFDELVERDRALVLEPDMWCVAELHDTAAAARAGDDDAVAAAVRGHLEISGITTVDELATATTLPPRRVEAGLARLERDGFALQGSYTPGTDDPSDRARSRTEWVARRLLARMHSSSRRVRRSGVEPATAQDFMRFLLRWQHVAPGTQLGGDAGLAAALEQLQGYEAAAVAWEPELLRRRVRQYEPAMLDRLCHDGAVTWLRLSPRPRDDADAPVGAPSKATPISVVFRSDLEWLLDATRNGGGVTEPTVGATAEIIEVLRERGACFAGELVEATRRLPDDVERGLWDGVARGLLTSDGFGAIRARVAPPTRAHRRAATVPVAPGWPHRRAERRTLVAGAASVRFRGRVRRRTRRRPARSRRSGGRAAARALGCGVPRPRGPRLAGVAVARRAVGAPPTRGPRPGARRALRHRLQRRAVRAPRSGRAARSGAQVAPHRRAGHGERHRPAQPGRCRRARRHRSRGPHQPGHLRRRRRRRPPRPSRPSQRTCVTRVGITDQLTPVGGAGKGRRP